MFGVGWKNHHQKNGKAHLLLFWSQNRLIPCLLTTSRLSGGDYSSLVSGKETKGWPPYGGQPFVLVPDLSTRRAPWEEWESIKRQGTNRFCDQKGCKYCFPFFPWWFFESNPSNSGHIHRGSLKKMQFQTCGQIKMGRILSYQCFRTTQ